MKSRKLVTLQRIFLGGVSNFMRNAWLSAAAMAVMVVTLSITLFSFIANQTFSHTIQEIRGKIDVSVYLRDDVTADERQSLISDIKSIQNVREVEYISKEDALKNFVELNKNNTDLQLAILNAENKLPATLRVKLYDPDNIDQLKAFLDKPEIQEFQSDQTSYSGDRKEAIDNISKATAFFRRAGIIGVLIFAGISVLIIFNTIQMAIFNRRDELAIMNLLGASRFYIRGPFLVESILIGVLSALISVALCKGAFSIASNTLGASTFGLLDIAYSGKFFTNNFWAILASQIGLGVLIGITSSYIATQRYLRNKK